MKKSIKINVVLNMLKQLCSVLFPLITIPYVSRVLQKTNYGKYNFGNSIVSYFLLLAGLGITNYAIREGARVRDDKKIEKFSNEVFTINIYSTVISYIILFIFLAFSARLYDYRTLILIQSAAILLTTVGTDWVNSIYEDYLYITIRYLVMQCIALVCLFLFVKQPEDYIKYAIITVIASSGGNLFNIFYVRKYVHLRLVKNCNIKQHIKPILLLFFNAVAVTIYVNSDMTLLGILQSEDAVGIYGLSTKIYLVVKQVLNAVIIVSLPRLSALLGQNDENGFKQLSNKIMDALCTIVFPAVVGLFILSREVILIVGGAEYVEGAAALRILSISLGFAVLAGFYCCAIILPFKQEKILLIASLISSLTNIGLNFLTIPLWSYNGAALTTLISEAIVFLIYLHCSKKFPKVGCAKQVMFSVAIGCIGVVLVCIGVRNVVSGTYFITAFSIIGSGIVYFSIQLIMKNRIVMQVLKTAINKIKLRG